MKVWLLTREVNEYDQYGEYFEAVFQNKPTHQDLTKLGVETRFLKHTLNGGGRTKELERIWFHLKEIDLL